MSKNKIDWFSELTSTNDTAREDRYIHGDIVVADFQNGGRGQRGNSWQSEAGKNLTFSVVLVPDFVPAGEQFLVSEMVALAVADTLAEYGIAAQIKWPNDIYVGDRKIAGILIENDVCGMTLARSIAGIGLNVNQYKFPSDLPNPTSMLLEASASVGCKVEDFDRSEVLGHFHKFLALRYSACQVGDTMAVDNDFLGRLYRINEPFPYRDSDGKFIGIIRNVLPSGELIVEHVATGVERSYLFKEIEFVFSR